MKLLRSRWFILLVVAICFGCTPLSPRLVVRYTLQGVQMELKPLTSGMDPAWSPGGKEIAYSHNGIRVYNLEEESSSKLASDGTSPAWSPDGRYIAYADDGIRIFDTQTESIRIITEEGKSPSWSPDGKEIAYSLDGIRVVDIESKKSTLLTREGINPFWSPQGDRILFSHLDTESLEFYIWFVDVSQKFNRKLIDRALDPAYNSDGKRLAYSSGGIWVAPSSAIGPVRLTNYGIQPSWSPDGEKIAFVYKDTIWVIDSPYSTKEEKEVEE